MSGLFDGPVWIFVRSTDKGRLRLLLPPSIQGKVRSCFATLNDELGELTAINAIDQAVEAPTGKYYVTAVQLAVQDEHDVIWHYRFHAFAHHLHEVRTNQECQILLLADLRFTLQLPELPNGATPDQELSVRPWLFDPQGLFAVNGWTEVEQRGLSSTAEVRLVDHEGKTIHSHESGFR